MRLLEARHRRLPHGLLRALSLVMRKLFRFRLQPLRRQR